jgi:hypothetical protein
MAEVDDKNFAVAVNLIEQLAVAWAAGEEPTRLVIREQLERLMSGMTNEQVTALIQYESHMVKQQEQGLERLRQHLAEAEADLKRRKAKE